MKKNEKSNCGMLGIAGTVKMPAIAGGTRIELLGNRQAVIEGCGGILQYDTDQIRIRAGKLCACFKGRSLSIRCLNRDSMVIEGYISGVEFLV